MLVTPADALGPRDSWNYSSRLRALSPFFGFAQFDLAGTLPLADGRYLARAGDAGLESVLVIQTLAAPPRPGRKRRRPRDAEAAPIAPAVPITRATAIRAFEPFDDPEKAAAWLATATAADAAIDAVVENGIALLNTALHAHAVAAADPTTVAVAAERAVAVRIGFGSGEQTAAGGYAEAREVDVGPSGASRRRRRQEGLRPQERVAALLRGRERADACETLLLRARLDLDAGRRREAALQLRPAVEALLAELPGALEDPDHRRDIESLEELRPAIEGDADRALKDELPPDAEPSTREALEIAERVLRRRRILGS
ncbi:MAG: hypothetical protein JSU06_11565 [Actinobacteria bacterium]|nr:hypothetical protein [Actinomycetota bacterium]